ncbi:MAG: sulfate permease [Proteobacteria bacterium]|nr:sulfate permease [Pseudomonadota bacterium]MCP4916551.1 sulfate permease [Pseudomonadota bacterium]
MREMTGTPQSTLERFLPFMAWARTYDRATLRSDAAAGLTTAVMLIPQGMAYAMLAGLPPIMGLYAATAPLLVYALLGTSRQLAIGPVAMASLVMAAGLNELLLAGAVLEENLVAAAILVTVVAGGIQVLLGLFRLGGLVNLLSHPVVSGFTGAAALIIGASQLQHVTGFEIPRGLSAFGTLAYAATNIGDTHVVSMAIGVGGIAFIAILGKVAPKLPAALIAVIVATLASWLLDFEGLGVSVLGAVPSGLPVPSVPTMSWELVQPLLPLGLTIALIGFMESISGAKIYARQNGYEVDPKQELVSLGLANVAAGMVGGYTVGGALSRTAVNAQAGARTPMAGVVTAAAIGLTLALLTPLFHLLPRAILASIILVAVTGLIDIEEVRHLWRVKRDDLALLVVTFAATLFLTIELGILIGVGASLLWFVATSTRPEIATLGRLPGTTSYRSVEHFPEAEVFHRILILRMDAEFFFGNVAYLKDTLWKRLRQTEDPCALVLDASSMNALDSTAADTYGALIKELRARKVEVFISHVKGSVFKVMEETALIELLGEGHMFYEANDAVVAAMKHRAAVEDGLATDEEDFGPSDAVD